MANSKTRMNKNTRQNLLKRLKETRRNRRPVINRRFVSNTNNPNVKKYEKYVTKQMQNARLYKDIQKGKCRGSDCVTCLTGDKTCVFDDKKKKCIKRYKKKGIMSRKRKYGFKINRKELKNSIGLSKFVTDVHFCEKPDVNQKKNRLRKTKKDPRWGAHGRIYNNPEFLREFEWN